VLDTVSLRWIYSGHYDRQISLPDLRPAGGEPAGPTGWRRRWVSLVVAASVAMVAAAYWGRLVDREELEPNEARTRLAEATIPRDEAASADAARRPIATVTSLAHVTWAPDSPAPTLLSRVQVGQILRFSDGALELTFDSGARVKVFGPAGFEITSPLSICCARGRVTTLVGESGKGFTIDTPKARIVDLGTEFGVDISEHGDTQVVVFQGSVDLSRHTEAVAGEAESKATAGWTRRLQQGDAMMVGDDREAHRVMAVQRSDFFPSSNPIGRLHGPVIRDVRDNLRADESTKCYQIVHNGLRDDALGFADRAHEWNGLDGNGLPSFLQGADYVMPFNDDKFISHLRVEVDVARPATCYVFLDDNMTPPEWLKKEFQDTGFDIGLDGAQTIWHKQHDLGVGSGESVDFTFSVWKQEVPKARTVVLGGVDPPGQGFRSRGFNMYGIAVVAK
jgi:hypothetical protein